MQAVGDSIAQPEPSSDVGAAAADIAKPDDSGVEVPSDEDEVNGPEDEMLTGALGLFYDPTADCEGDDFEDTVPTYEDTGRFGVRGKSSLLPSDVCELLKSQRLGFEPHSHQDGYSAENLDFQVFLILYLIWSWLC